MSNKNLIGNVICGHFMSDNAFTKITTTAWRRMPSRPEIMSILHRHRAASLFMLPSGVCLHRLSTDQLEHGFQRGKKERKKETLAALQMQPPCSLPGLWALVWRSRHKEQSVQAPTGGSNTWKASVLQGETGWRKIRMDALHLSLWIQALSQFYSQRETFHSPSFE